MGKKQLLLLISLLLLCLFKVEAQDGHQWTQQFGSGSMFLGGSVIGSVSDLGAVYYNPGRLSEIDEQIIVYSGNIYEISVLKVKDLIGSQGYNEKKFRGVPNLTAGTFKLPFLNGHNFAWAVLSKSDSELDMELKDDQFGDVFTSIPGDEYFNATLNIKNKLRDTWSCLSWSHPLDDKTSIGVTAVYKHLSSTKGLSSDMAAMDENTTTATYAYSSRVDFKFNGLLWKAGIARNFKNGHVGLTILTPTLKISGKGKYRYENFASGLENYTEIDDIYGLSNQKDLPVTYRSPWAIGFGISQNIKQNRVHFGMEWYSHIAEYSILRANPFTIQSSGQNMDFELIDQHKSIVNFGLGLELYVSEKLKSFASFFTDFNSLKPLDESSLQQSLFNPIRANYYHLGGGFLLKLKGTSISLGLSHSGTRSKLSRPITFPEFSSANYDHENNTRIIWNRWRIMFSLSVPIFKDIQQRLGF
ncbi:hypothetical protein [Mangrovibacterium diazotrophicum]|uniref:Long-chain fatty acid transport protein n=1 Tax=Mangrovibacterium diazotrophicum TaxID=1261403 RepID=A0A419W726_9BACT|nr:hypothetical protein [Mangrovibacterium diazotrophicum]RKD91274.1 hypothetical protein BC643_1623 [Mangrovibacterium diazotrophicum]